MMDWLIGNWRDAILIVVGLIGIYMVLSVMRLVQVSRASARIDLPLDPMGYVEPNDLVDLSQNMPVHAFTETVAEPEPTLSQASGVAEEVPTLFSRLGRWAHPMAPAATLASETSTQDFADELRRSNLEVEVAQLRRESDVLRNELASVHEELGLLKAARNVSPLYSEAATLAQRGVPADGIAGQCGISLGEAELVAALARADGRREPGEYSPQQAFETGEDGHGGFPHRRARTGTHG